MHLPTYLASSVHHANTRLREAFSILQQMHKLGITPLDEVCIYVRHYVDLFMWLH